MKVVIAGGTGYLGRLLTAHFTKHQHADVYVLTRRQIQNEAHVYYLHWDGETKGDWPVVLEGADLLINLSGKSVNCRYTPKHKEEIYTSRLKSTKVLCEAVLALKQPPKVFIQSSSATIYQHSEEAFMTEAEGRIGADFSMDVCKAWEQLFKSYTFRNTKKIITRTSIVLGNNGGAFPIMKRMTRLGLGGKQGSGRQYISWITEDDYTRAIAFLSTQNEGVYNICVPNPIRNEAFQKTLRKKIKVAFGFNTPKWLLQLGAICMGTETELILKSRCVYPEKLLNLGFKFRTPTFKAFDV